VSRHPRRAAALLVLALAAGWASSRLAAGGEDRVVLAAVDVAAFSALQDLAPSARLELWERLKAMGVGVALLREETLADLAARGEVLYFSRSEVEKWRAAGLTSAGSALKGDSLWVRDSKILARIAAPLAARGLDVSTAASGPRVLELPSGFDLAAVTAGFDPGASSSVASAGLLPAAASSGAEISVAGRTLRTRTLAVDARRGEILRAAYGRPLRLIVFAPHAGLGLDANLDFLRASLRVLRESGLPTVLAERPVSGPSGRVDRTTRLFLVWLAAAVGPLIALRVALRAARATRERLSFLPKVASPVPEVLAGLVAAYVVAALSGLIVAWLAPVGWRDGSARAWTFWTQLAPLAAGAAALFALEPSILPRWGEPIRVRDAAVFALILAAAALLLAPRACLRAASLLEFIDGLSPAAGVLWWWPWRWREALIGAPCLAVALALVEEHDRSDPKGWLLLGLLAPAGLVAAVGGSGVPVFVALEQGAVSFAFGAAVAGLGGLFAGWVYGPTSNRSIDLEPSNS